MGTVCDNFLVGWVIVKYRDCDKVIKTADASSFFFFFFFFLCLYYYLSIWSVRCDYARSLCSILDTTVLAVRYASDTDDSTTLSRSSSVDTSIDRFVSVVNSFVASWVFFLLLLLPYLLTYFLGKQINSTTLLLASCFLLLASSCFVSSVCLVCMICLYDISLCCDVMWCGVVFVPFRSLLSLIMLRYAVTVYCYSVLLQCTATATATATLFLWKSFFFCENRSGLFVLYCISTSAHTHATSHNKNHLFTGLEKLGCAGQLYYGPHIIT
jgi:hypothetical protein